MSNDSAGSEREPADSRKKLRTWGSASGQQQATVGNMHEERQQPGSYSTTEQVQSYSPLTAGAGRRTMQEMNIDSDHQLHTTPSAAAYVTVTGSIDGGPRSPSRLRCSYSSIASPRQRRTTNGLPEFLQVEQPAAGTAPEDVHVQHVCPDEQQQQADVQDKIISQVDELVEYFNALYHDDQVDICQLQQELDGKNIELNIQNEIIQRLRAARPVAATMVTGTNQGVWSAAKQAWRPKHTCWCLLFLLFLIALLLAIVLPATLIKGAAPVPPSFSRSPQLLSATSSSVDLSVGVSKPTAVHYVMVPKPAGRRLQAGSSTLQQYTSADIAAAAAGWGTTALEGYATACGSLFASSSSSNITFSISTLASNECAIQRAQYASGGQKPSCERCPQLQPAMVYDVLLVVGVNDVLSSPIYLEVSTLAAPSSTAPTISSSPSSITSSTTGSSNRTATAVQANAAAASESSFRLTFTLDTPGTVKYLVVYDNMYARFGDRYVTFANSVTDASVMMYTSRSSFQGGVVARGEMQISSARTAYTCTIGGNLDSNCSCSYGAPCSQEVGCFGGLCDYSTTALAPNTTYKVVLVPVSQDSSTLGSPISLGPFTTLPSTTPPTPSAAMAIAASVGPDRFTLQNMQQDKTGYMHVVVTQPFNQAYKLTAGTGSPFTHISDSSSSRRHLLASNDAVRLPAEAGPDRAGALFFPPCKEPLSCNASSTMTTAVNPLVEVLVFQKCVPIHTITEKDAMIVTALQNATLYRVVTIHSDTSSNKAVWSAMVRTQDLTPPVLTVIDTPPPDFDKFSVTVQLDEPGTIYGGLMLAANQQRVSASVACEPLFEGPMAGTMAPVIVPDNSQSVTVTFDGLTANTDYLLKLIAKDNFGNCQGQFTDLLVHTLDNVPPVTLSMDVVNVEGSSAALQLTLNEPGTVYYLVLDSSAGPATCPNADQLFSLTVPAGVTLPSPSCLGNFTVAAANTPTMHNINGLTSQTPYRACAVAHDNTRLQNKQTAASLKDFTTLDVTPPVLTVQPLPSSDGNFTCSRTSYMCSLLFTTKLNEPGEILWALMPHESLPATLPTPQQLFSSSSNVTATLPDAIATGSSPAASTNTIVAAVASDSVYVLLLTARDTAKVSDGSLQPNYIPVLTQVVLVAPDVTPPIFSDASLSGANDTELTLTVTLNEASVVHYIVVPHPSTLPSPSQVAAGMAANGSVPSTAGTATAAAATATPFQATGLLPGHLYDVYLVAEDDPAHNLQLNVTNITNVRTTDSMPPVIVALSARFTPPMSFTVNANSSKPGWIIYAARKAAEPAPTAAEVLSAFQTGSTALANFTSTVDVPAAGVPVTGSECVADGDQLMVYAVAQDAEGNWPGRQNNTSPVSSAVVQLVQPNFGSSCIPPVFLAPLRPTVSFAKTPLLAGLMLGPGSSSVGSTGVTWQQEAAGLVAADVQLSARAQAVKLPGGVYLPMRPNPPAAVSVFIQSTALIPDANGPEGTTLRLSYQLTDAAGRTQVDTTGLTIRPILSYATGATPPAGTTAAGNVLPDCDVSGVGAASGVGQCSVAVAKKYFPATGMLDANIVLKALIGSVQATASANSPVQLKAAPSSPAFSPSTPGLLATLPYRPVYMGEVVKVTLEAVNGLQQGLTGFTVPLKYNMQQLSFVSAQLSGLWLVPAQAAVPTAAGGNYNVIALQTYGRAGNNPDSAYRSSSSIPLVDVYFRVITNIPGTAANIISITPAPSRFSFDPSWTNPFYQVNSFNGQGTSGALNIGAVSTLGMWAWATTFDVFNTAALTGQKVTAVLRGALVKTYGAVDVVAGDVVNGCVIAAGDTGAASALADQAVCQVTVDAVNTVAAKGMTVTVSVSTGGLADATAQVLMNVWYPSNLSLSAADTTLNKVLPINAADPRASCLDMYQSTPLKLTADWGNGGTAAGDSWPAADITDLATYKSSNTNVAIMQTGAIVKGVHAGITTISINPIPGSPLTLPSLAITVSNTAVCLKQLSALATTGAGLTAAAAAAFAVQPARTAARTAVTWEAQQQLVWEDSSALVLSYATFSDGSVMDVSGGAQVTASMPAASLSPVLPFSLLTDNSTQQSFIRVNATVGSSNITCQQYLTTAWSVCSLPLGAGSGAVRIQLPSPAAVANFSAAPGDITSTANAASLPPVLLPTSSSLSLLVSFSDGSVRDFSSDSRTVYTVTAGAGVCSVVQAAGGVSRVVAVGNLPGLCEVTATVTFPNNNPLTASTRISVVTMTELEVAALEVNTCALPDPMASSQLLPDDTLLLLKCDARNYDTRTLWSLGVLSNCTSNSTCPMLGSINDARYLSLSSSNTSVADIMTGFPEQNNYPTYGLLGNRLVPFTAGSTTASIIFGSNSSGVAPVSRNISVTVKDTYQPTWPVAAAVSDTSVAIAANMSDQFTVTYQLVEGSTLDLTGNPPTPAVVETAGVSLVPTSSQGPFYLAATAAGLKPGTNYTMLTTVRQGLVLAPGVTAVTGILVPDTTAPSFTRSAVKVPATPNAVTGDWSVRLDMGLNEQGTVYFAIYGDPSCVTGDPAYDEVKSGANLADQSVNKCNCSSSYCRAAAKGEITFAGSSTSDVVTITAAKPPFPFDDLPSVATCIQYAATTYASKEHAVYFVAEDDLPTYKGWTSSCSVPIAPQNTLPTPCAPVTVSYCNNTPPAVETVNRQALPFTAVDMYTASSAAAAPAMAPLKGTITVVDSLPAGFQQAVLNSTGSSLIFTFQTSKIGLVMWRLVEQVVVEIANGYVAVKDSSVVHTVKMDRKCNGVSLVPGTAYALWYNMTDIYGSTTDINILKMNL